MRITLRQPFASASTIRANLSVGVLVQIPHAPNGIAPLPQTLAATIRPHSIGRPKRILPSVWGKPG